MTTEMKPQGYYTDKIFTPADMDKAIAKEREACAKLVEDYIVPSISQEMSRIIRARGEA